MKTKDRLKEEIGFEKLIMTLLVALISSFSSWTWGNREIIPVVDTDFALLVIAYRSSGLSILIS